MKLNDALRKSGVFRAGATTGTYTSAKDRPIEFQMDGVFDAEKDLVTSKSSTTEVNESKVTPSTKESTPNDTKKPKSKWKKITLIGGGSLLALFVLLALFGTPSAEMVFKDSLDTMLQTESLTVRQEFTGSGEEIGSLTMDAQNFIDLTSEELRAKGSFSIELQSSGVPIRVVGEYIALDDRKFVKIDTLESSNPTYDAQFSEAESNLRGKWISVRSEDNFTTIASTPLDALTEITALPFANIEDEARKEIVKILQDDASFTILESSKVSVDGADAYRYELTFNEDKQDEVAKKIKEATGYLTIGDGSDNSKITKLELWIDINTKRFIKMQYEGTSDNGTIEALVTFSDYNEQQAVDQPSEYFIESELLN